LNCDQVFDVLTRGPFPSGGADDEAVENHLRACHDCRRLAEALRPAVELLHEAVSDGEALDLPEYQGALACDLPGRRRAAPASPVHETATARLPSPALATETVRARADERAIAASAVRFIAASLIVAVVTILAARAMLSSRGSPVLAGLGSGLFSNKVDEPLSDGLPSADALLTLASLKLPAACLPLTHRPSSPRHAAELADALATGTLDALRCCTECHRAGASHGERSRLIAAAEQSCRGCHRG
jgi:hypothetical protein